MSRFKALNNELKLFKEKIKEKIKEKKRENKEMNEKTKTGLEILQAAVLLGILGDVLLRETP